MTVQEVFGLETAVKRLYEAMFLVDSAQASDWDAVVKTIKTILQRADAEIVSIRNWAERKLAYEINGKTRGTYILCYFRADGDRIRDIERDVQLSERIMRVLILSPETREKQDIESDLISQKDGEMGTQGEVKQAAANRKRGRLEALEATAADASPVRNALKPNNMNEKRKISNGASESKQLDREPHN